MMEKLIFMAEENISGHYDNMIDDPIGTILRGSYGVAMGGVIDLFYMFIISTISIIMGWKAQSPTPAVAFFAVSSFLLGEALATYTFIFRLATALGLVMLLYQIYSNR